jgi:hypothetical protein
LEAGGLAGVGEDDSEEDDLSPVGDQSPELQPLPFIFTKNTGYDLKENRKGPNGNNN